jgi:haloalkane dehalogenase
MVGFDWAVRHPEAVRGIVHMESIVRPSTWADYEDPFRSLLLDVRRDDSEAFSTIAEDYVERALELEVINPLPEQVRDVYLRKAETDKYDKRAVITALNQIPIGGQPSQARSIVSEYTEWLRHTDVPKLLVMGRPGYIHAGRMGASAAKLPEQTTVHVMGSHQLAEDSPDGVIRFLRSFIAKLPN